MASLDSLANALQGASSSLGVGSALESLSNSLSGSSSGFIDKNDPGFFVPSTSDLPSGSEIDPGFLRPSTSDLPSGSEIDPGFNPNKNSGLLESINNNGGYSTLEDTHSLNGSLNEAIKNNGGYSTLEDKHTLNGSLNDYIKGNDDVTIETLPERGQIGPNGEIIRDEAIIETLPERGQIGPNGEIIRDSGETKVIEYSSFQNKLTDENFNKLSDAEVKEKMKDLYFKEGLNEEQVKNKLKETENLSSSELKEIFKVQYNNASVNGLLNKTASSFVTGGASGFVSGGDRMSITVSEIPNIVSKLRSCESRVREIWSELLNTYIQQIENSWAGADAQAYIEKVRGYNSKIENSAQALSLLADTYEKVIATSQDTQQKVMNAVNNY